MKNSVKNSIVVRSISQTSAVLLAAAFILAFYLLFIATLSLARVTGFTMPGVERLMIGLGVPPRFAEGLAGVLLAILGGAVGVSEALLLGRAVALVGKCGIRSPLYTCQYNTFKVYRAGTVRVTVEFSKDGCGQGVAVDAGGRLLQGRGSLAELPIVWGGGAPESAAFLVPAGVRRFGVTMVWRSEDGTVEGWRPLAEMQAYTIRNGRRYRCNDGRSRGMGTDYDSFVFRVECNRS